jgi:adenylosuccinate lyase
MPHKVNPIDFENAEGNFGLANALLTHLAQKLPVSRFQRDLSDSTVLRNTGVALGYTLLGHDSLARGLSKLELDREAQYERLKALTQGKAVDRNAMRAFIDTLVELPEAERARLRAMTPASYVGKAAALAKRAGGS